MANEFVYCPRLFHVEWVQRRFATSDDVEEGRYIHRVVDQPGGDLPDPDDDLERFAGRTSRSFWLTSTTLGVSAKIDIVEVGDDGTVTPVDYKKGAKRRLTAGHTARFRRAVFPVTVTGLHRGDHSRAMAWRL